MRSKILLWVLFMFLLGWAAVQVFPVIWMYYSSLKPSNEITSNVWALPAKPTFESWRITWRGEYGNITVNRYMFNSAVVCSVSLVLVTLCACMAGYAMARYKFSGRGVASVLLLGSMVIPTHTLLIPLYTMLYKMHLTETYTGLILPYVAFNLPFTILLARAFFVTFPREIEEAARVDGCGDLGVFLRIVMPSSKAILATLLVVTFPGLWNEYILAMTIITSNTMKTLPVGIALYQDQWGTRWDFVFAGTSIATVPAIVVYFIFQRRIVRGMTLGSVKG